MNQFFRLGIYILLAFWLIGLVGFIVNASHISAERGTLFITGFSLFFVSIAIYEQIRVKRLP